MSLIEPVSVDRQQTYDDSVFPYAFLGSAADSQPHSQPHSQPCTLGQTTQWVSSHRDEILRLAAQHGAVLFRDVGVESVDGFDAIVSALELENFPYKRSLSNAVRVNRTERVFSANEAPSEVQIFFHHEMAQTPLFPRWIMFSCEIAAEQGGATPLCRSDVLYQRLMIERPEFAKACEQRGLQYTNVMPGTDDAQSGMGRSWASTLGVETKQAAETRLAELNYSWQWMDNGDLRATTPPLPAVMELEDGRKTFFNQLIAAFCGWKDERNDPSNAIRHGDGTSLDTDAVKHAAAIADDITFDMNWQAGDVVVIDNTLVMHARRSFVGKRKVVASLAQMQTQSFELVS